jgi:hypothetical protein
MNLKIFISFIFFIVLTSCSLSNDTSNPKFVKTEWHLKTVSGGIDGVNNSFDFNTVIWTFDESLGVFYVVNNNTNTSNEDGFDSGTYTYSLQDNGNNSFITINQNEFGSLTILNKQLIINQNEKSTGSGADGYIYTFQLVEVIE